MIDYEQIPFQYGLCLRADCKQASHCLRYLAFEAQPEYVTFVRVLVPRKCASADGRCAYYRSSVPVSHARGFTRVLKDFPMKVLDAFRSRMITAYPRVKYFRMRRGDLLLTPSEQDYIVRTARKQGFTGEFTFDSYEDNYLW